jgi:hypothetical protein
MPGTRHITYPRVYGVRLSERDGAKFEQLLDHFGCCPSELLRPLIRSAEVTNQWPVQYKKVETSELCEI